MIFHRQSHGRSGFACADYQSTPLRQLGRQVPGYYTQRIGGSGSSMEAIEQQFTGIHILAFTTIAALETGHELSMVLR